MVLLDAAEREEGGGYIGKHVQYFRATLPQNTTCNIRTYEELSVSSAICEIRIEWH